MNKPRLCKWCDMVVKEVCSHLNCVQANSRGFCTIGCETTYYANLKPQGNQYDQDIANG